MARPQSVANQPQGTVSQLYPACGLLLEPEDPKPQITNKLRLILHHSSPASLRRLLFLRLQLCLLSFFPFQAGQNSATTVTFPTWLDKHTTQCFAGNLCLNPMTALRLMTGDSGFLRNSLNNNSLWIYLGSFRASNRGHIGDIFAAFWGSLILWVYVY